jgi:hypothetical protein
MHIPTYLVAWLGVLMLLVGTVWLVTSRRRRRRLSQEEAETRDGLDKIAKRTGTRRGTAESVDEDRISNHDSLGALGGDAAGDGD